MDTQRNPTREPKKPKRNQRNLPKKSNQKLRLCLPCHKKDPIVKVDVGHEALTQKDNMTFTFQKITPETDVVLSCKCHGDLA